MSHWEESILLFSPFYFIGNSMQITHQDQLATGRTYYRVMRVNAKNNWIDSLQVLGEPYLTNFNNVFIHVLRITDEGISRLDTRSLKDMNIPENNYNEHRLFTNYEEAQLYLNSTIKYTKRPTLRFPLF